MKQQDLRGGPGDDRQREPTAEQAAGYAGGGQVQAADGQTGADIGHIRQGRVLAIDEYRDGKLVGMQERLERGVGVGV